MTVKRLVTIAFVAAVIMRPAFGEAPARLESPGQARDPTVLVDTDVLRVKGRVEAVLAGFGYSGTWYGLGSVNNPTGFATRRGWGEGWLEPGVDLILRPGGPFEIYGGLSVGLSGTLGSDSFGSRNQGAVLIENAFAGVRTTNPKTSWNIDLSAGQQDYGVGTGMLIWQGAGNGFERGGLNILQRTAWSNAVVARISYNGLSAEGFFLDPNEVKSVDTGTKLAGGTIQYRWGEKSLIGAAYVRVLESSQVYPLPTLPLFIADGRDGLQAINGFSYVEGAPFGLPNAWIRGEFALERNDRIDMRANAYYGEVGYQFANLPLMPSISYGYASFSGDNPNTTRYERFDPLYYGNGLENWWFGANGAYAFLNSNVNNHRVTLKLIAGQQDLLMFQYVTTNANQLSSPIQFGQAARLGVVNGVFNIVSGVTAPHLADELYGQWVHVFTPHIASTLWASVSFPGSGLRTIPNDQINPWAGIGAILSMRY